MSTGGELVLALRRVVSLAWCLEARFRGIELGRNVRMYGRPVLTRHPKSLFQLGDDVVLNSSVRANPLGNALPCVLRTVAPGARLTMGSQAGASSSVIVAAQCVAIGEGTQIGAGSLIMDTDLHERSPVDRTIGNARDSSARPVQIGKHVFVGARTIILKGVSIGDYATVGAGSIVTRDVEAGTCVAGNPARPIR